MNPNMIYAIYDMKTGAYMQPWFTPTEAAAKRAFGDAARDKEHAIGLHPEDYVLCQVGTWHPEQGTILVLETPHTIMNGLEAVRPMSLQEVNANA